MALEAPYRKGGSPAQADTDPYAADKQESDAKIVTEPLEAAKRTVAPQEEEAEVSQPDEEELVAEEEDDSQEVPEVDPDEVASRLRHADYTRKTQALAEERRTLEGRFQGYEVLDNFIAQNPQLAETHTLAQIVQMIQAPGSVTAQNQPSLSSEDRTALNTVRREIQQERESLFFDRVEEVIRGTAKRYGMTKAEQIAFTKRAVDEDFVKVGMGRDAMRGKLDILARAMKYPDAERKGQSKLIGKLKEKQRASSGTQTSAAPAPATERPKGWAKLIDHYTRNS